MSLLLGRLSYDQVQTRDVQHNLPSLTPGPNPDETANSGELLGRIGDVAIKYRLICRETS